MCSDLMEFCILFRATTEKALNFYGAFIHVPRFFISALFRDNDEYKLIWSMSDMRTSLHHKIKRLEDLKPHENFPSYYD